MCVCVCVSVYVHTSVQPSQFKNRTPVIAAAHNNRHLKATRTGDIDSNSQIQIEFLDNRTATGEKGASP